MKQSREKVVEAANGWVMLLVGLVVLLGSIAGTIYLIANENPLGIITILTGVVGIITLTGLFTLQPNEARVLILFGKYVGAVRASGFHWANPFYSKKRVSLRARNFDGQQLKVNEKRGNPIEISAVIVWRVADTAKAIFDVDDYANFVRVQSESALRQLANAFPYDHGNDEDHPSEDEGEVTLRSGRSEVNATLRKQVQERLEKAGVAIEEARLNHLAYAPEIASAMLRRQQAEAIIAARRKIVHGAVSMVEMALQDLTQQNVVELDEERKASMVSNLLVVLCGETDAQPVINAGTLYS